MNKTFQLSTKELFHFIKKEKSSKKNWLNSIEITDGYYLLPVSSVFVENEQIIALLTKWRNQFVEVFPTQFEATISSTKTWLKNILLPSDRKILFLIVSNNGEFCGHIGLHLTDGEISVLEIDNVIKNPDIHVKGLMKLAMSSLIEWARTNLPVDSFRLKVFSDNHKAVAFYSRNGFREIERIALKREAGATSINFVPSSSIVDAEFVVMELSQEETVGDKLILTAGPSISQMEGYFAYDAAMNGWNSQWSKYLTEFEAEFAQYIGVKYAIATSSCTGALQISLLALGIGPGDEVIVPDVTWVATASAVRDVGATPVFCDIDLHTYNMDIVDCLSKVTDRTRAIMPVHLYGNPANMQDLLVFSKARGIHIIEDAAPAIGATINGQLVGSFGDFGCFSFQGAKLLVTGEGGMLVTDDAELYAKARKVSDQGRNPDRAFWIDGTGVKFKMSNVQAAIGLAQLRRCDLQVQMKQRLTSWYKYYLRDLNCIEFPEEYPNSKSIQWMTSIRVLENASKSRDELITYLRQNNIDTRVVFPSISSYPIWNNVNESGKNALILEKSALNLPSGVKLKKSEVEYICKKIIEGLS